MNRVILPGLLPGIKHYQIIGECVVATNQHTWLIIKSLQKYPLFYQSNDVWTMKCGWTKL